MLIKSRNFSPTKCEKTWESDGVGLNPAYAKKFEGSHKNSPRYGKNYSKAFGRCVKCDKYTEVDGTNGEHCVLPINEHCQR